MKTGIAVDYYDGIPIVVTDAITKKVRSRTHRKKRIDKKWLRRYGFKEVTDHSKVVLINGTLYMSQKLYDRLKEELVKMGGSHEKSI